MSLASRPKSRLLLAILRVVIVLAGVTTCALMFKPRIAIGFGFIQLMLLWPLLVGLLVIGIFAPWTTSMWRKDPKNSWLMFSLYASGLLYICYLGLMITGWLEPAW